MQNYPGCEVGMDKKHTHILSCKCYVLSNLVSLVAEQTMTNACHAELFRVSSDGTCVKDLTLLLGYLPHVK